MIANEKILDKAIANFHKSLKKQIRYYMKAKKVSVYKLCQLTGFYQSNLTIFFKSENGMNVSTLLKIVVALDLDVEIKTGKNANILSVQLNAK